MNYRRLGRSGLQVSELSLGTWVTFGDQIGLDVAKKLLHTAYDAGINFFDNAESYSHGQSERMMGEVLHDAKWRRDSYIVSSKVFFGSQRNPLPTQRGLSRKHVVEACHQALKRLRVDYLDLYFCHRPDVDTPIDETVRAMSDLIRQGKVLYWGTSEWSAARIMEACAVAYREHLIPPTMEQSQYNMLNRQRVEGEYRDLYERIGLGTTIWSPLASGVLTGKYNSGIPAGSRLALGGYTWLRNMIVDKEAWMIDKAIALKALADRIGIDMIHLALAWCLKNKNVSTVILGASNTDQLQHNIRAPQAVAHLTDGVMEEIENIMGNKPLVEEV